MDQNGIANRSPLATNAAREANKNKRLWTGTRLDQRFAAAITGPHPVPRTIAASARAASAPATQRIGGREGHGDGRSTREESFD